MISLKSTAILLLSWCIGLIYLLSWFVQEVFIGYWWHFPTLLLISVTLVISWIVLFKIDEVYNDITKED